MEQLQWNSVWRAYHNVSSVFTFATEPKHTCSWSRTHAILYTILGHSATDICQSSQYKIQSLLQVDKLLRPRLVVMTVTMRIPVSFDGSPCSLVKIYQHSEGIFFFLYSKKMQTTCFSETSITLHHTTRCHVTKYINFQNHSSADIKSHLICTSQCADC